MLRNLPSISFPTMPHPHPHSQPKTPPSTPSLEKGGLRSTSKRSKPLYYAHEITTYKRYTRCLHAIIVLLMISLAVLWHMGGRGCGGREDGGLSFIPWMGSKTTTTGGRGMDTPSMTEGTMADGHGDVVHAVQQCGIVLEASEEGCLRPVSLRGFTVDGKRGERSVEGGERWIGGIVEGVD